MSRPPPARPLHSFPTRRSSDLDVDGLYDGPPSRPGTRRIAEVHDPDELTGIEVTGRGTTIGTGGMVTKLEAASRSEEHTSELQSRGQLVCRLLLAKHNDK